MPKKNVLLAALVGAFFLILVVAEAPVSSSLAGEVGIPPGYGAATGGNGFVFSDDTSAKKLTLENANLKIVWHYGYQRTEFNNRGGGNIYELYDKRTDPQAVRNLVGNIDYGTGSTGPPLIGIGGLGSTYLYGAGLGNPATGDNGHFARLVDGSMSYYVDADGNAVFTAAYIVRKWVLPYSPDSPDNYRVDKKWTVYPEGQIKYEVKVTLLRDFTAPDPGIAEPYYGFVFSRDYGWTKAAAWRHDRHDVTRRGPCQNTGSDGYANSANGFLTFNDIDSNDHAISDRNYSLGHTQYFTLYGQQNGVSVRVKMDNGGKGFENGGLFAFGSEKWGGLAENVTSEFSNANLLPTQASYGLGRGYSIHWYGWWGGGAPPPERYRTAHAGESWSDTFSIELLTNSDLASPRVENVRTTEEISSATVEWDTNVASSTVLEYWERGSNTRHRVSVDGWTPKHKVVLNSLRAGKTYDFEIVSGDGSGETRTSGSFATNAGVFLDLGQESVRWDSYADYTNRLLTVDFVARNLGSEPFNQAEIVAVNNSSGVETRRYTAQLGDLAVGDSVQFQVAYFVPVGVRSFKTELVFKGFNSSGTEIFFPQVPPGF